MTQRKGKSITEYVTAPAEFRWNYDRVWPRKLFLLAIEEHAPVVLQALRDSVLPVYLPFHPGTEKDRYLLSCCSDPQEKVEKQIWEAVTRWADLFNLRGRGPTASDSRSAEPSFLELADGIVIRTLLAWGADPGHPLKWCKLQEHSLGAHTEIPDEILVRVDGWAFLLETEADFRGRVSSQMESQVREHIERCRSDPRKFTKVPLRRASNHFAYLTLFQCLRRSHTQIAKQLGGSRTTVSEGIAKAAEAVIGPSYGNWLMPPLGGGRPPHRRQASVNP